MSLRFPLQLKNLLKEEEAWAEFVAGFRSYGYVREPLVKFFELRIKELEVSYDDKTIYDCPNMALKEADNRGMRRAFREIINLLKEGLDHGES